MGSSELNGTGIQAATDYDLFLAAIKWYQELVADKNIDSYYHQSVLKHHQVPLVQKFASSIYDPKIFAVMKTDKAARYAAIDGWLRMMWMGDELPRWVREAIAVAVSTANDCDY